MLDAAYEATLRAALRRALARLQHMDLEAFSAHYRTRNAALEADIERARTA